MKRSRKPLWFLSLFVLFAGISVGILLLATLRNAQNLSVATPDLSHVSDGDYTGEYAIAPVFVRVVVSVEDHRITNIVILQHQNGLGNRAERLAGAVVETQSLEVDTVSGATVSSKCILKAVECAITGT